MATREDVEKDQYDKIHALTAEVKENSGRVVQLTASVDVANKLIVKQMEQSAEEHKAAVAELRSMHDSYAKMTKWFMGALVTIILFLIGVIAYGAIGEKGIYAVRDAMPKVAGVPWHNDFEKHQNNSLNMAA